METAAKFARAGNRILGIFAALLIAVMFLYGSYSLWDTAMVYQGAFLSDDLLQYKPSVEEEEAHPTLQQLQAINQDITAWLTIDDTHIDYPVVQGEEDMDYINTDIYGEFSLSGSIFMDSRNTPDFSDPYTVVFGHHMDNGGMFGDVVEFINEDYFSAHESGVLYLPDSTYRITLFACVETDAYNSVIYNITQYEEGDLSALLAYIRENAVQYRDIGISSDDTVIGLSTCAEAETNGRVVLFGKLDEWSQKQEGGVNK